MCRVLLVALTLLAPVLCHGKHSYELKSGYFDVAMGYLFPFCSRYNSLLATLYLSMVPGLMAFVIPGLRTSSDDALFLPLMVSFAFGGLMGDVLLCLLPEIFRSNELDTAGRIIDMMRNPEEKVVSELIKLSQYRGSPPSLSFAVFTGFVLFMGIDKMVRIMNGDDSGADGHSHSHLHAYPEDSAEAIQSSSEVHSEKSLIKKNKKDQKSVKSSSAIIKNQVDSKESTKKSKNVVPSSLRTPVYLNLISSFAHNFTDGLALATAFYTSRTVGITTTIAVLMHEIPHELGDIAIAISSGFSFKYALKSHIITSIGAMVGTLIGCAINELGIYNTFSPQIIPEIGIPIKFTTDAIQLLGVSFQDLLLPITTGGFIYIGTVGIVPELLKTRNPNNTSKECISSLLQLGAMCAGFGLIFLMKE
ncbi:Zn(2+) transporter YKE4 Ecym_4358 [Eremothecium cymbalariae DBVPG|uniref:Uncharacterized protein n=1 Tax=Eremothecium cymbalariae (strain CBS 270.75 / DBVPG 7215 / KCTC 17166 / NRRL Y-17582) TaxID=931890 RepID=G8JTR5_ERECY|nr:hypothetical protein Ecym_4358 [Eremothecium cymbalariae DBVPG\